MAEQTAPAASRTAPALPIPAGSADPGRLDIHDKALVSIATKAARDVPGSVAHTPAAGRVTGRRLPRAETTTASRHVHAAVHIALTWPTPAGSVAAAVREAVRTQLTSLAGLRVEHVDVTVDAVLPPGAGREDRRVQ